MKVIGKAFGFRREMIVKGVLNSRFQMIHRLLKVSGGILGLGMIGIYFYPVEPSGWPDLLLINLPNECA